MRAGIGLVLALAVAAVGCRSVTRKLGLYEDTAKDMSDKNTKVGDYLRRPAQRKGGSPVAVKVAKFEIDPKAAPGLVKIELVNEGDPEDFLAFDVELGYPAPPGSIAPYLNEIVEIPFSEWKKNEKKAIEARGTGAIKAVPLFARILTEVRMPAAREQSNMGLRRGTTFLGGKVEVVKVDGDLAPPAGTKPRMVFTLESISDTEVGNIKYMVQFFKDGVPVDLGRRLGSFRSASKPLGKKGDTVEVDVEVPPESAAGLTSAIPVLNVIQ